jgi:acyl carrier protein
MRVGVDLMSVSRFAEVAQHRRYRTLVFTETELAQADRVGPERRLERLAGRFCVKEATCKMLGRGFGQGLRWRDIEVTNDLWGAPVVTLTGGARELADEAGVDEDIVVTLSHQVDLVIAVAIAATGRLPRPYRGEWAPGAPDRDHDRLTELAAVAAELFEVHAEDVKVARSFVGDLGVTSMLIIELLARLERRYGVQLDEQDFYRMTNLPRTYDVVAHAAGW